MILQSFVEINPELRINISTLVPGLYMVYWCPETGVIQKGKFMKID